MLDESDTTECASSERAQNFEVVQIELFHSEAFPALINLFLRFMVVQFWFIDLISLFLLHAAFSGLGSQKFLFEKLLLFGQGERLISVSMNFVLLRVGQVLEILISLGTFNRFPLLPFMLELFFLLLAVHYDGLIVLVSVIHIDFSLA